MEEYDAAVAGGGVAGSVTARFAAKSGCVRWRVQYLRNGQLLRAYSGGGGGG